MLKRNFCFYIKESRCHRFIIFIGFLIIDLIAVFTFRSIAKPIGYEYEEIATNLLKGLGYQGKFIWAKGPEPTSFMAPIYPFLLFLDFKIFGLKAFLPVQILQAFVLAIVPVISYPLWKKLFKSEFVAILGAFILALNYPYPFWAGYIGVPTFLSLGTIITILFFIRAFENKRVIDFIILGLVLGIFLLLDPIILMIFVSGTVWMSLFLKPKWKVSYCVLILLVATAVTSPWLIRNYRTFGRFPLIKSTFGLNLLEGNSPIASGGLYTKEGVHTTEGLINIFPDTVLEKFKRVNEIERADICQKLAFNYIKKMIKEDPLRFFQLRLNAYLYFWLGQAWHINYKPALKEGWSGHVSKLLPIMVLVFSLLLIITAILGMVKAGKPGSIGWFIIIILLLYPLPYVITKGHSLVRYRAVLDPLLAGYSSFFIFGLLFRKREMKK